MYRKRVNPVVAVWIAETAQRWPSEEDALNQWERIVWPAGVSCAHCGASVVRFRIARRRMRTRWYCLSCQKLFSAVYGTLLHRTHVPLRLWFVMIGTLLQASGRLGVAQLATGLKLPYKTVWAMVRRIRSEMRKPQPASQFRQLAELDAHRRDLRQAYRAF